MKIVFAFDRDNTVSCSELPGPVPVALVRALASKYPVWAIGNRKLGAEAGIPDLNALWEKVGKPSGHMAETNETAEEIAADPAKKMRNIIAKRCRLLALGSLYPEATLKIVVDDFDVATRGWRYFTPEQFTIMAAAFFTTAVGAIECPQN